MTALHGHPGRRQPHDRDLPPDSATKMVLVATHVVAAAIIVPALVRRPGPAR